MMVSTASTTSSYGTDGPDDFADRRIVGGRAAERDLVEFLALLVHAEQADMADMVVAAGVDAAGDVHEHHADVVLPLQVGEPRRQRLRHRDRARVGEAQ